MEHFLCLLLLLSFMSLTSPVSALLNAAAARNKIDSLRASLPLKEDVPADEEDDDFCNCFARFFSSS